MGVLGGSLGQLGGGFSSVGNVISGFAGAGVMGAASAAISEGIQGLQWAVTQAGEAETAITNLSIAVEKSGTAWATVSEATQKTLGDMQSVTTYSDEQLAAALERLLTFGMSYDDAMKALSTTVDLAAAKHLDLQTASDLVGKAFTGNTAILSRYGIDITTAKEASSALEESQKLLGQAIEAAGYDLGDMSGDLAELLPNFDELGIKFDDAKTVAKGLADALAEGKISTQDYAGILQSVGVNIDTTKLSASGFSGVMDQLNERFGGTAQDQAKTYAGIQERLKNATSDLGEKIGGLLLPALAGITEGMIPVVDWLGEGIAKAQGWIETLSKMPEVKAASDALSTAFSGLQKWFGNVASAAMEELGPALSELWDAFKAIANALEPVFEALGEIWAAFTEGEGSGNILKDILSMVAESIKLIALGIKEAAPYIKMAAQAFKDAADFIVPPIQAMMKTIGDFIAWLRDTFQGFYNWLVGKSLWSDMWGAVASLTTQMAGQILGNLTKGLLDPMRNAISSALSAIKSMWDSAMRGLGDAAKSIWNLLTGHSIWTDMLDQMVSQTRDAMGAIQGEFAQGIIGPSGIVPIVQSAAPAFAGGMGGAAAVGPVERQAITLPINVYLDGQQIQSFLERRLVETISRDAGRSRRA